MEESALRPKSGLPKRRPLRNTPRFSFGFRDNPVTASYRNPLIGRSLLSFNVRPIRTVSLFAGCGGFDIGILGGFKYLDELYKPLPFDIIGAYDIDTKAVETYKLNIAENAEICDLAEIDITTLPQADLLLGGFPCQDFSSSGLKLGLEGKRGRLYRVLVEYMRIHQPKIVIGENVPHFGRMYDGKILQTVLEELEETGYKFRVWDIHCPDFGLPQSRRRLFLVGVRNDIKNHLIPPAITHFMGYRSIDAAIDDLKHITDETAHL